MTIREYLLIVGITVFLLWYDRCLFTDILATIMLAVVAALMAMLSSLCFLAILVMLPVNLWGRILGYDTKAWTGNVVTAIMLAMKPFQRKAEDSRTIVGAVLCPACNAPLHHDNARDEWDCPSCLLSFSVEVKS